MDSRHRLLFLGVLVIALFSPTSYAEPIAEPQDSILTLQYDKIIEVKNSDLPLSSRLCREYIALAKQYADKRHLAQAYNELSYNYHMFSDFDSAYWAVDQAKLLAVEVGDSILLASATIHKGMFLNRQMRSFEAYQELTEGARICKSIGFDLGLMRCEGNIGNIFLTMQMPLQARIQYEAILKLDSNIVTTSLEAATNSNIGQTYLLEGDSAKAKRYFVKAIKFAQQSNHLEYEAVTLGELIDLLMEQNDWVEARRYNDMLKRVTEEMKSPSHLGAYLTRQSLILHWEGQWSEALKYALEAAEIADAVMDLETMSESQEALYKAYEGIGNGGKALFHLKRYNELIEKQQKSSMSEDVQRLTFETKMREDSMIRAQENYLLDLKHKEVLATQKTMKQLYLAGGILALIFAGGFFSRWRYVKKSKAVIEAEKDRSENLLLNILPAEIAEELKENGEAAARNFEQVTILFTDFKGFTELSEILSAEELVQELNICFKAFDAICEKYKVEKIKTLGDSYMATGGLPIPKEDSAHRVTLAALEMADFVLERAKERSSLGVVPFEMRAGIHTGHVVAGIVGVKKFQYDIWGDTVNTASRMESSGEVGKVNISQATYELVKDDPQFLFEHRGKIAAKGKGDIDMYFVALQ